MYKTSTDLRFIKNRAVLQRAFIDLTLEKQTTRISVKELTERAQVNRMTFYSHYDEVSDILLEFVDGITAQLIERCRGNNLLAESCEESHVRLCGGSREKSCVEQAISGTSSSTVGQLLRDATEIMQEEIEFYRLVAKDQHFELYRRQFRKAFATIFSEELHECCALEEPECEIAAGMIASGVTYAYLDWLAGKYGTVSLDDLLVFCERFISGTPYFAHTLNRESDAVGAVSVDLADANPADVDSVSVDLADANPADVDLADANPADANPTGTDPAGMDPAGAGLDALKPDKAKTHEKNSVNKNPNKESDERALCRR